MPESDGGTGAIASAPTLPSTQTDAPVRPSTPPPSMSGSPTTYRSVELGAPMQPELAFAERYTQPRALGEGGMGQLLVTKDVVIGRDIALKRMLAKRGDRGRFIREARIQGQLEHPAIVPVYDVGLDAAGEAWFTMKQIRGVTLAEIVSRLRAGDADALATYSRRRLLSAFTNVCLAIDFAHTRGVVHRDLKPANIMLGDFGEVYVLDWGIAKVVGFAGADDDLARSLGETGTTEASASAPTIRTVTSAELDDNTPTALTPAEHTGLGEVIGTVGYMPPEQLCGHIEQIGPHTDVWALGAILFELLTLERLMPRTSLAEAITNSTTPIDAHPSARAPGADIAPELDGICARAVALAPDERYRSARELSNAIERFLDGDRDAAMRRDLARAHVTRAQQEAAHDSGDAPDALAARRRAMQEIGRAVALDPALPEATDTMVRLLLTPPTRMPDDARDELRASEDKAIRLAGTYGALGMLAMYLFLPAYMWAGIHDWTALGVSSFAVAVAAAGAAALGKWPHRQRTLVPLIVVAAAFLLFTLSRVASPFILPPLIGVSLAAATILNPAGTHWAVAIALGTVPVIAAVGLELVGVLSPTFTFRDGALVILPRMLGFAPNTTVILLVASCVATVTAISLYLASVRRELRSAQERLHMHTWHLRNLVPAAIASRLREQGGP